VRTFGDDLAVVGLHSVFEHHEAVTPAVLKAFLHQNRIRFPVGIDTHESRNPEPATFVRYDMQGTPTVVLIDREGNIRAQHLGVVDDMPVAAAVTHLLDEPAEEVGPGSG
jgi:thioredoxin-related protein